MSEPLSERADSPTRQQRERKKRYLGATVVTCIALAMVFGTFHVVELGAKRMADMRQRASYDLSEESLHIRAAGEDLARHKQHQEAKTAVQTYGIEELNTLLPVEQWKELNTQVLIAPNPFIMGTNVERADAQNKPEHTVTLPAFYIDKYLVTNAQYAQFVVATRHRPPLDWHNGKMPELKIEHPVTMVSWYDAKAYCEWGGKRLPTEAEWEKAARGTDARRWPWGDKIDPARLNTYYNVGATNKVTQYSSGVSPYGVFDMAGNVSQWTASDFKPYNSSPAAADLFKPKKAVMSDTTSGMKVADFIEVDASYKVRRGGSWKSDPFSTSSYHRDFSLPHYASDFFGFRCAKDAQENKP